MGFKGCCARTPCRWLWFLTVMAMDVADLVSDWLFYVDVSLAEAGLVYGKPEQAAVWALLAFSIIGILTFLFEAVNLWWEVFRGDPWFNTDLVNAAVIWFEDIPQIAINVYIAFCREDPISVFQLSKASIVLIGLAIRIILYLVKYCYEEQLCKRGEGKNCTCKRKTYRVFSMLGLFITAACAALVFVFTQTQQDLQGNVNFQVPESIFEDRYNDARYFQNVSVFVHHPDFDASLPSASTGFKTNWVRFMSINDIRDRANLDISYNPVTEKTDTHLKMALYTKEDLRTGSEVAAGQWQLAECHEVDLASQVVRQLNHSTCMGATFFSTNASRVFITFRFIQPSPIFRRLIFGDIRYNIKYVSAGQCSDYHSMTDSVSDDVGLPSIHYYRVNANFTQSSSKHLLVEGSAPRFYRSDGVDLQDITEVWKTGWGQCDSSTSISPHLERDIPADCSNL